MEVDPDSFHAQLDLGWINLRLARYEDALAPLQKALAFYPENPAGHVYLGRALIELGREAEGVKELQTAVHRDPTVKELPEFPKNKV